LPGRASHGIAEAAHRLARSARETARAGDCRADAPARRADELTTAAHSAGCLPGIAQGLLYSLAGDYLAFYLRARRRQEELAARIHAAGDASAIQAGWTVTRTTGRVGSGNRSYRDPRFDRLRAERAGRGPG